MSNHTENSPAAEVDQFYMREALALAERGLGWAAPNPAVGVVLVRDGRVIGRGAHLADGSEHAEALALREAGEARAATCYVSLEPCSHFGRQPPCSQALVEAGVARVVYGCRDTDPRSAGKSAALLRAAGIEVDDDVLGDECRRFLDYYLHAKSSSRAFMHAKLALSADGKMACPNGASQWLSGAASLGYAHYLRQKYDAILVGYRTVLADNPRLTTRAEELAAYRPLIAEHGPRNPVRIVLDPRFELLGGYTALKIGNLRGPFRDNLPRLLFAGSAAFAPTAAALPSGVELLTLPAGDGGQIEFATLAAGLYALGIHSVLVEGGPRLAAELLRQRSADKLSLVYTPLLIGSDGLGFTPALGLSSIAECPELKDSHAALLGRDLLLEGYPQWPR